MLDRFELLVGKENVDKLKKKTVLILGLGGVGGQVAESLIRSGIANFIIIDFDKIELTNLNRQIFTNINNIGKKKAEELKERMLSINPNANIKAIESFIDETNIEDLFLNKIDFFIDACDSIKTKKLVIDNCISKNIDFITCMGTGNRLDPSLLKIKKIENTSYDPVAKIIRKHCKDMKYKNKVICLCSEETPLKTGKKIGSTSFVPPAAGLLISSYVVKHLISK